MTESIQNLQKMMALQKHVKKMRPLIHCITNPISIHDCANVVLAAGGRPIMAEHPREVEQITETAQALMLNLGNITDVRMESMKRSLAAANKKGIPVLLDLVGVACSDLRREYASELLQTGTISVLKGNMSEILEMAGEESHSIGIDAGIQDTLTPENLEKVIECFQSMAKRTGAVILASGKTDLIVDAAEVYAVENGDAMMTEITGTGCMLGAVCSTYLGGVHVSTAQNTCEIKMIHAVLLGAAVMGIAGELAAEDSHGPGSFQIRFLDFLYQIDGKLLGIKGKINRVL